MKRRGKLALDSMCMRCVSELVRGFYGNLVKSWRSALDSIDASHPQGRDFVDVNRPLLAILAAVGHVMLFLLVYPCFECAPAPLESSLALHRRPLVWCRMLALVWFSQVLKYGSIGTTPWCAHPRTSLANVYNIRGTTRWWAASMCACFWDWLHNVHSGWPSWNGSGMVLMRWWVCEIRDASASADESSKATLAGGLPSLSAQLRQLTKHSRWFRVVLNDHDHVHCAIYPLFLLYCIFFM